MSATSGSQSLYGLLNIPSGVMGLLYGLLDIHWLKNLPFLYGLKTKVRLRRINFIRIRNRALRGLSGVLLTVIKGRSSKTSCPSPVAINSSNIVKVHCVILFTCKRKFQRHVLRACYRRLSRKVTFQQRRRRYWHWLELWFVHLVVS